MEPVRDRLELLHHLRKLHLSETKDERKPIDSFSDSSVLPTTKILVDEFHKSHNWASRELPFEVSENYSKGCYSSRLYCDMLKCIGAAGYLGVGANYTGAIFTISHSTVCPMDIPSNVIESKNALDNVTEIKTIALKEDSEDGLTTLFLQSYESILNQIKSGYEGLSGDTTLTKAYRFKSEGMVSICSEATLDIIYRTDIMIGFSRLSIDIHLGQLVSMSKAMIKLRTIGTAIPYFA